MKCFLGALIRDRDGGGSSQSVVCRPLGFLRPFRDTTKMQFAFFFLSCCGDVGTDGTKATVGKRADALAQTTVWDWQLLRSSVPCTSVK